MPTNTVRTAFIASIQRRSAIEASFIEEAMRLRTRYGTQRQLRRLISVIATCMLVSIFYTFFRLHWTIAANNDMRASRVLQQHGQPRMVEPMYFGDADAWQWNRALPYEDDDDEEESNENDEGEVIYEENRVEERLEKNRRIPDKENTNEKAEYEEDDEKGDVEQEEEENEEEEETEKGEEEEEEEETEKDGDEEEGEETEKVEEEEEEDETEKGEDEEEEEETKKGEEEEAEEETEKGGEENEDEDENERAFADNRYEDLREAAKGDGVEADADSLYKVNEEVFKEMIAEEYENKKRAIAIAQDINQKSVVRIGISAEASTKSPSSTISSLPQPSENYNNEESTCDTECELFRRSLAEWPTGKPKAVIYYLIYRAALRSLSRSISSVNRHFRRQFNYPIIVFIEPDLDNEVDRKQIHDMAGGDSMPLYIQVVRFQIPPYVDASAVPKMAGFGRRKRTIGYRHMCRFHAGGVYQQPIMRSAGLEFGWRLDDDSLISSAINYDIFRYMSMRSIQYGYRKINTGWSPVDFRLWDAVDIYVNTSRNALRTPFYDEWPKNAARYFNNFEISALSVWMSQPYRDYFQFVDRLGGIYYYKWGDAAIKTIAVTLFIPKEKTFEFKEIKYVHMRVRNKKN